MLVKHCDLCGSEIRKDVINEFKVKRKVRYLSFEEGYSRFVWERIYICSGCLNQIVKKTRAEAKSASE